MIVNLPPLGCLPALLTLYAEDDSGQYDTYGCLDSLNKISTTHNELLESRVIDLRSNYTNATLYYADLYNVYIDVLKSPADYGTHLLKSSETSNELLAFASTHWVLIPEYARS